MNRNTIKAKCRFPSTMILLSRLKIYSATFFDKKKAAQRCNVGWRYPFRLQERGRLVIDEAKALFAKKAFEQYAAGITQKRIVAELNAAGLRNRNGKPFGHTALQVALQNEKYIGIQRFSDIVIEDACPALVDRETFDKVQERIKQNRREGGKNKAKMEYLLTGKAFCGYCGSTITGVSSKGRHNEPHYYYACRNRRLGNDCKRRMKRKTF